MVLRRTCAESTELGREVSVIICVELLYWERNASYVEGCVYEFGWSVLKRDLLFPGKLGYENRVRDITKLLQSDLNSQDIFTNSKPILKTIKQIHPWGKRKNTKNYNLTKQIHLLQLGTYKPSLYITVLCVCDHIFWGWHFPYEKKDNRATKTTSQGIPATRFAVVMNVFSQVSHHL